MAFSTLLDILIGVGKPVKREIFTTLKDNQDDLDARLSVVEEVANKIVVFNGNISSPSQAASLTRLKTYRVQAAFDLTDARLSIYSFTGSPTGLIEFDVLKSSSPDPTAAVSVFTTKPSLDFASASNYDVSTNALLDNTEKVLAAGDYLFLSITSLPTPVVGAFHIYLIGEVS